MAADPLHVCEHKQITADCFACRPTPFQLAREALQEAVKIAENDPHWTTGKSAARVLASLERWGYRIIR